MAIKVGPTIAAAFALIIHIIVGAVLVTALTGGAIALNFVAKFCEAHELAPRFAVWGLRGLEILVWIADVFCLVIFLLAEVWKFCVTVWKEREA